ncbi:MAG: hypothetical protein NUV92_00705 [Ignavibacteria bacterium]|jgi:hypothetical protein|nr:hypothetical protein [Ignavibacteria bacterium]MDH7528631.1 hypothetical protein [Ignavibacteria bacterium]
MPFRIKIIQLMLIIPFLFLSINCQKENLQLRFYDVDIFAMPMDEEGTTQEVIVSLKSEGFKVVKTEGNYKFHLQLEIDLITPDNKTINGITKIDSIAVQKEKFDKYVNLELSFVLDKTYTPGKYQAIIRGKDLLGGQTTEVTQEFNLD